MPTDKTIPLTDASIVARANDLARRLYRRMGYEVPDGFKFYAEGVNARARFAWDLAAEAFEALAATDINDAVSGLDD